VLYDCVFDKVEFPTDYGTSFKIFQHFKVFKRNFHILMFEESNDGDTFRCWSLYKYLGQVIKPYFGRKVGRWNIEEEKSGDGILNKKRFGKKFLEDEDIKGPGNLHRTFCLKD